MFESLEKIIYIYLFIFHVSLYIYIYIYILVKNIVRITVFQLYIKNNLAKNANPCYNLQICSL